MNKICIIFILVSLFLVFGCTGSSSKTGLNCPGRGILDSDNSYCVALCMVNRTDSGLNQDHCQEVCDLLEYGGGSPALQKRIQSYRCSKCGDCPTAQTQASSSSNINSEQNNETNISTSQTEQGISYNRSTDITTQGTNLALGKTATASINSQTAEGALDGDITTYTDAHRFATNTANYAGNWWEVDLGSQTNVGRIVIYANPGASWSDFPVKWHIDYSFDGNNWTRLVTETSSPPQVPIQYNFTSVDARYLRITADQTDGTHWWYMQEFEVFEN